MGCVGCLGGFAVVLSLAGQRGCWGSGRRGSGKLWLAVDGLREEAVVCVAVRHGGMVGVWQEVSGVLRRPVTAEVGYCHRM